MSQPRRLDLAKPRGIQELLGESLAIYLQNFLRLTLIAAAVVAPVHLIVLGIGLEELTAPYRDTQTRAERLIPTAVTFLVVAPLIAATTISALRSLAAGQTPRVRQSLQAGLDAFAPVFVAVTLAGAGIVLGLLALVVPGIYVLVRWFFVPQMVVIGGKRTTAALTGSWALVQGFWWRTLSIAVLTNLVAAAPGLLILSPLQLLAESADRQAVQLAGTILSQIVSAPLVAIVSTLLFYDLNARRAPAPLSSPGASP